MINRVIGEIERAVNLLGTLQPSSNEYHTVLGNIEMLTIVLDDLTESLVDSTTKEVGHTTSKSVVEIADTPLDEPVQESVQEPVVESQEEPELTYDIMRAFMVDAISSHGLNAKDILKDFVPEDMPVNLKNVPPENYAALKERVQEVIKNA